MAFDAATYEIDPLTLTEPRDRLMYLRDFLRRLPAERFDMGRAGEPEDAESGECGTAACIAGWARAKFRYAGCSWAQDLDPLAADLFGLGEADAAALFYPVGAFNADRDYYAATPDEAAIVLDHLIQTGRVDWSVARKVEA